MEKKKEKKVLIGSAYKKAKAKKEAKKKEK